MIIKDLLEYKLFCPPSSQAHLQSHKIGFEVKNFKETREFLKKHCRRRVWWLIHY